ncbi:MAG: hypothetical protein KDA28_12890, partial [Phycisphaerales bacterium]|nr:hypothetical protein [Phycisphaerales bacterium]
VSPMDDPPEDLTLRLTRLPDPATDPFRSLEDRCATTMELYRFESTGGGLVDWAAMQTGLADPLSRFSRHELEDRFARFRSLLDAHLADLVRELRKRDVETLRRLASQAPREAQTALRRAVAR